MNKYITPTNEESNTKQDSDLLLKKYLQFIHTHLGIVIHKHQLVHLNKVIKSACQKFSVTPDRYLELLKKADEQSNLLEHLVTGITVGETYFFRDNRQMHFLYNVLLPEIIIRKRQEKNLNLRIWSAGCSSGEEIYTIAIMLKELLPDFKNWTLNLLGTDINSILLRKAVLGKYTSWSLRSINDYYKQKYFNQTGNEYTLIDQIKNQVHFDYLNLNENNYPSILNNTQCQDLIICRNVLIYFDTEVCEALMQKLGNSLSLGGYLLLGASDPINLKNTNLVYLHDKGMLFRKPSDEMRRVKVEKATTQYVPPTIKKSKSIITVRKVEEHAPPVDSTQLNNQATSLANIGKLAEALKLIENSITLDAMNKFTYLLQALILCELNDFPAAENALRRTIYLDRKFVLGHYQLGLLLIKKDPTQGLKFLQNALGIANTKSEGEVVEGSQNLSFGNLKVILQHELEIYATESAYARKNT